MREGQQALDDGEHACLTGGSKADGGECVGVALEIGEGTAASGLSTWARKRAMLAL